jgi:shikimate kinase
MKNFNSITLIGMPGSGKNTIGKLLAKKLNYKFIDSDINT